MISASQLTLYWLRLRLIHSHTCFQLATAQPAEHCGRSSSCSNKCAAEIGVSAKRLECKNGTPAVRHKEIIRLVMMMALLECECRGKV